MDTPPRKSFAQESSPRLSSSPASTPRIIGAPSSPAQSIHLDLHNLNMESHSKESIHDQPDHGLRTTDFFDDTTDEEIGSPVQLQDASSVIDDSLSIGTDLREHIDASHKRKSRRTSSSTKSPYLNGPPADEYITDCGNATDSARGLNISGGGMSSARMQPTPDVRGCIRLTQTPNSQQKSWLQFSPQRPPRPEVDNSEGLADVLDADLVTPITGQARPISFQRADSGGQIIHCSSRTPKISVPTVNVEDTAIDGQSAAAPDVAVTSITAEAAKDELIMSAHTRTLQALLRDDSALQQAATTQTARISFVPEPDGRTPIPPGSKKRVSLAPLPLDTRTIRGSIPDDIVRTPYPMTFRKSYTRPSPLSASLTTAEDSILPLRIWRCGAHALHHAGTRCVSHITLPAKISAASDVDMMGASSKVKEDHFDALEWDDMHFFKILRGEYVKLSGRWRLVSARKLKGVRIVHSTRDGNWECAPACSHGFANCTHGGPSSPRYKISKGLTESFSEAELLKHLRNPRLGKAKYSWVHWAKRISSMPIVPHEHKSCSLASSSTARSASGGTENFKLEDIAEDTLELHDGYAFSLQFVEGWSASRILLALLIADFLAIAAALSWIMLGTMEIHESGYRNAGGRLEGGMMLGLFVLLMGWTSVAGWLGLSWLVQ